MSQKHFHYKPLRDSFQTALLNLLHKRLGDSFKKVKSRIYADQKMGSMSEPYAHNPNQVIKYIGRYLGRPVIATSRIDSYDGDFVTFHYNRHEAKTDDGNPSRSWFHCPFKAYPRKHFKMIRYYGIYARHRKSDRLLRRAISKEKHKIYLFSTAGGTRSFILGYDPLKMSQLWHSHALLEPYFNHRPVPHELYEKAMRKYRCRSRPLSSLSHPSFSWYNETILNLNGGGYYQTYDGSGALQKNYGRNIFKILQRAWLLRKSVTWMMMTFWIMDYFLHEFDDMDDDDFGEEGFYIF